MLTPPRVPAEPPPVPPGAELRWYRLDATKLSLSECYAITQALPTMLRILSTRREGRPFLMGPPVSDARPVEESPLSVRPEILADVSGLTRAMEALGLERLLVLRERQPTRARETLVFVLADSGRRTAALVRWAGVQTHGVVHRELDVSFVSRAEGDIVVTTTLARGHRSAPGIYVANVPWSQPAALLARHQDRIPEPGSLGDPVALVRELRAREFAELERRGALHPVDADALGVQVLAAEAAAVAARPAPRGRRPTPVTAAYVATCVAVWVVAWVAEDAVLGALAMPPLGLVTSAAVHLNWLHLLFNVGWLWDLGPTAERWLGPARFVLFVAGAAVVSAIAQLLSGVLGIGASGVVYALVGYLWMLRRRVPEVRSALSEREIHFALVWLVIGVGLTRSGALPIGNAAHAGGLAFGILMGKPWAKAAQGQEEQ